MCRKVGKARTRGLWLTDFARRELQATRDAEARAAAMRALFGQPWPNAWQAIVLELNVVPSYPVAANR